MHPEIRKAHAKHKLPLRKSRMKRECETGAKILRTAGMPLAAGILERQAKGIN